MKRGAGNQRTARGPPCKISIWEEFFLVISFSTRNPVGGCTIPDAGRAQDSNTWPWVRRILMLGHMLVGFWYWECTSWVLMLAMHALGYDAGYSRAVPDDCHAHAESGCWPCTRWFQVVVIRDPATGYKRARSWWWSYTRKILKLPFFLSRLTRQRVESAIAAYDSDLLQGHIV